MSKHVFVNHCINWEEILSVADIDTMLKIVDRQSKSELAKMRVDFANYKDYDKNESCSVYYGMFVEWLAENFMEYFGHAYNVEGVKMFNNTESANEDYGVDGIARTVREVNKKDFIATGRRPVQGSPVYIQVKGTRNRTKEFMPNDGSRLPNFMTHAQMLAMKEQKAYQARYVLFTTGKGLHYTMEKMCGNLIEVIGYKDIKHHIKNNGVFLNRLRISVGLQEIPMVDSPIDADAPIFSDVEIADTVA